MSAAQDQAGFAAVSGGISALAGFKEPNTQAAGVAAQSLFSASAAANAIPVAGQFVSAGLAIAGLFVKIFAGRKKKKREEAKARQEKKMSEASTAVKAGTQSGGSGGVGTGDERSTAMAGQLAPVSGPAAQSFGSWGGGAAPSVQPTQQVINNKIGI